MQTTSMRVTLTSGEEGLWVSGSGLQRIRSRVKVLSGAGLGPVTVRFSAPILKENTLGVRGTRRTSTSRKDLRLDDYLKDKGTTHLQTSMPSPGFEPRPTAQQSGSLTTMPDLHPILRK
ncbi:hypothetical protein TNCV_4508991 [Trichonephila clavipes]|nr:hypothetical protein TNCV_4508991 [Trichonephila clavipes]